MKIWTKTLLALVALAGLVPAQMEVKSLGDLRKIEAQVQGVARSATQATVSLVSPRIGASGSGVVVSEDGLILTAAHVIEGSEEMTVIFPDGRQETAKVLGANYSRDAAMARLVGEGPWPHAKLGNSDELKVGDFVVALGHPKGYDPTRQPPVRFGRVMTKGLFDFVTTDCTLIGGDSGGPLFDLKGRVVGIHSNIGPDRQINNHAGLAGFRSSWDKLLAGRSWGKLGGDPRDPDRAVMGLVLRNNGEGLQVEEVSPGSPAVEAGFQIGDRVVSIDGVTLTQLDELSEIFVDFLPGDQVDVTLERDGKTLTKKLTLARLGDIYQSQRR